MAIAIPLILVSAMIAVNIANMRLKTKMNCLMTFIPMQPGNACLTPTLVYKIFRQRFAGVSFIQFCRVPVEVPGFFMLKNILQTLK
jgi:hypothetical protein